MLYWGFSEGEENAFDSQFARLMVSNAKPEYTTFSPIGILVINDDSRRKKLTKPGAPRLFGVDHAGCFKSDSYVCRAVEMQNFHKVFMCQSITCAVTKMLRPVSSETRK
jgi:hypothetical protein